MLGLSNCALHYRSGGLDADASATLHITRSAMDDIVLGADVGPAVARGDVAIEGDPAAFGELFGVLDDVDQAFRIVTP